MPIPKLSEVKNWTPEIEKEITDTWKVSEQFKFDSNTKKKIYSIDTPPPYINAPIHIGHATTYSYQDFFARNKRMKGFEVLFPLGLDRNGLPIEMGAEKKFKVTPQFVGREKFIEYCEQLLAETSTESIDTFAKLGISFTSYKEGKHTGSIYLTDSPEYRSLTQATFINLYKRGLVYEDTRINNWDSKLQTTIADSEIDYKDVPSTFNHVKWKVKGSNEELVIATTRPELICTCGMVIFHPDDERYKHLEGKKAITPIFNKEVTIKAHPLANPEKGSGLVMMCSAGDLSDIQFFREMNLTPVIAINKDGTMNGHAGLLQGLPVKKARERIIEVLKEKDLIVKQDQIVHRTPISERSGAELEFIEMPEFYLKQLEFKDEVRKIAKQLNFYPTEAKRILDDWIDSVSIDWPISRRRYYATPIPLWHSGDLVALPPEGKYYQPWKEGLPKDAVVLQHGKIVGKASEFSKEKWIGEIRVFDTWFDSSISELFILKYKSDDKFFKKAYPASLRPQGKEIVRTWLYYTLLRGYLETGKTCFNDVWIHQHIVDDKRRKMSKSLGNVIDPQEIIKKYGSEAFRFWAAIEGNLAKQDLKCSEDKIKAELKTLNKLLNVTRFIFQFEKPKKKPKLTSTDQLFTDYIEELTALSYKKYDEYDFHAPMLKLRNFLWEIFASNYLEMVKPRVYNRNKEFSEAESNSAKYTLHYITERFTMLIYPVIPQIATVIANESGIDLAKAKFPDAVAGKSNLILIDKILEFNSLVWKTKKEKNLPLNEPVTGIVLPEELKLFEKDLKLCHKLI